MQKISKNKGITLVSLIVTIIILMILAGVVIATVTGNNGILSKSKLARETYKNSANEENDQISSYENEIDKASIDIASSRDDNLNSKYEKILLFNSESGVTSGTYTFLDNHTVDEFNKLYFLMQSLDGNPWYCDNTIYVETWNIGIDNGGVLICPYSDYHFWFNEISKNSFKIRASRILKLIKIYGIK